MGNKLFEKILISNRGEIALRIIKTLKKMGIKSVAVYSEADTNSKHVQYADEAHYIGNSPATSSYLSIKNIIDAARKSGAQAIHPGYGFLSENPNFVNVLKREGIVFIGPSAQIIKKMGDKIEAKKIAIDAGVTTVPGYIGIISNISDATDIAKNVGFPVIIKAAAGGGGRGMRVVNNAKEMHKAYLSANIEAENCFNDGRLFIEKLIMAPRHIEVQLLADQYGNTVCLGERECSIQRHHQKIIEEAPSSFVDNILREKIYSEAINLSKRVGYYSAGTVEFMVDKDKNYYFLEMNTRLQVEHPITELITGVDIVEQMIRIAAEEKLSFNQNDIKLNGWAIESRICAEDPSRGFLPSSGRVLGYKEPPKDTNIRIDSGIDEGSTISMFYDPMIAKLCTYGDTRQNAITQMTNALSSFVIQGISHNISFLEAVINHQRFMLGDINTRFIEEEYPDGFSGATLTSETTKIFLASAIFIHISAQKRAASISGQINNQLNKIGTRWVVSIDNKQFPIIIKPIQDDTYNIRYRYEKIHIESKWHLGNPLFTAVVNGQKVNVKLENISTGYKLTHLGSTVKSFVRSPRIAELENLMKNIVIQEKQDTIYSPISGEVISINIKVGDKIKTGQELLVITAMKMENIIIAESDSIVKNILITNGEHIITEQKLIELE
ncbi:acetyl-CoA carboxylase biotin carboxylase subunit [Rickettsia endosymbiont of Cardiosporidium cionae]|uniref:acetyl-CoA carboxylase biotin carboxylase subunit n=1 Tax=Rickettsia endosymbiont of Cardiosporidium cionae TaxID=2777155 RepID=UPI001894C1FC|nr:acetyl/propionyl/methylcrotonyl-CoA carboxylase subunit alpha [Rickettsia endosymbiont of Cardiosporidium cionae]KAF8818687.1 acetyl/propionyl/methylcrotonyl-CoA carboxylase subunit alpha [Rickettsia endosymbiont of Cardiosporidium cionae]